MVLATWLMIALMVALFAATWAAEELGLATVPVVYDATLTGFDGDQLSSLLATPLEDPAPETYVTTVAL